MPFTIDKSEAFDYEDGDWVYVPGIRQKILDGADTFEGKVITKDGVRDITLYCKGLSDDDKLILTEGCLMNYYAAGYGK